MRLVRGPVHTTAVVCSTGLLKAIDAAALLGPHVCHAGFARVSSGEGQRAADVTGWWGQGL